MIRELAAKALARLSAITTLGSAPVPSWEEFWPGLVTRVIFDLDEAGDDEGIRVVLELLAEMQERLVPPMTPAEEHELAGTRYDKALERAKAVRRAGEREALAAEAEYLAAQANLRRFESSPGIPKPEFDPLRQEGGQGS